MHEPAGLVVPYRECGHPDIGVPSGNFPEEGSVAEPPIANVQDGPGASLDSERGPQGLESDELSHRVFLKRLFDRIAASCTGSPRDDCGWRGRPVPTRRLPPVSSGHHRRAWQPTVELPGHVRPRRVPHGV